jgi:hypothetical protein
MASFDSIIQELIKDLQPRQKMVLVKRFSLDHKGGKKGVTLAELGEKYGVTRERIRQIEEAAFVALRKRIHSGVGKEVFDYLHSELESAGGIKRETVIREALERHFGEKIGELPLRFLLEMDGSFGFYSEDKDFHDYWYRGEKNREAAQNLIDKAGKYLAQHKEEVLHARNFPALLPALSREFTASEGVGMNYLSISKKFGTSIYGDFGLTDWPEINPKTVRDRAYLILKEAKKPLHFREIAELIKSRRFDDKKVHASTAHNELIKDERFVLVGRGIYGLREHGFTPGTAREVISKILKNEGPQHPTELVKLVLKERLFKENTILLNLQNKKLFQRLEDGRYSTHQA